jgi:flagellar L-ring protein precursor FlgH
MQRGPLLTFAFLISGMFCGIADAQSNSLFGNTRSRAGAAPTTQPAAGAPETLLPLPGAAVYLPVTRDDEATPNEVLLAAALIAVPAPEPRKIHVHDRITIIIREEKRATSDSDLKSDRKWEVAAELKKWVRLNEECKLVPQNFTAGNPAMELDYEDKYQGKGKVGRKDSLITRVTATVIDVKPNGDLVLEAKKDIRVDEDRQVIKLTGICRSADVSAQNTVLSTQLADARIDIQHSGPARDAARRGWLARLWDLVRPL